MDIDLTQLLNLPAARRLEIAQLLWNSIPADADTVEVPLPPSHRAELERRMAEEIDDEDAGLPVDEALAELRQKLWPRA